MSHDREFNNFLSSLRDRGWFDGEIPDSKRHKELSAKALEEYKKTFPNACVACFFSFPFPSLSVAPLGALLIWLFCFFPLPFIGAWSFTVA
jgi:hypothetical protein